MKYYHLKLSDFARLFHAEKSDFPEKCRNIISNSDFSYHRIAAEQRDELIVQILKKIDSGILTISGPSRQSDWEHGWAENLREFTRTGDTYSLTPKFIRHDQPIRLENDYVVTSSERFEFDFVDVLRQWLFLKYFKNAATIYEFGCGSCQHIVLLAEMFPEAKIVGLDWAKSSIDIISALVKLKRWNIEGQLFNLFEPDSTLALKSGSAIFTVGTLEQLGNNFEPFLQYLLSNPVSLCMHLETIRELYDDNYLSDYLAIKYDSKRGYLNGFLPRLKELENQHRVEIVKTQHIKFGNLYHDSYSLVIWKPHAL
ncbi:MAG: class I SAM-dependent methyltransferase [Bacteroidia bacterium]|nr:class I SAM-dependent methyltransferase [Bacteroidia bacterium]